MDLRDVKVRQQFTYCHHHSGEIYTMFCITCDCLVCSYCILDNHYDQHKFCKMSEGFERKHEKLFQILKTNKTTSNVQTQKSDVAYGTKCEGHLTSTQKEDQKRLRTLVLRKLEQMSSEEKELSSLCDTLSKKINDRTDILIKTLEAERQRLLSKVKNSRSASSMRSRSNNKEELELCISYLNINETEPEFISGLEEPLRIRITDILISTLEKMGSTDTLDVSKCLTYTNPDETAVTSAIKSLIGDVTCSWVESEFSNKQVQCAKVDDQENKSQDTETGDIQKRTLSIPFTDITKILPKDEDSLYIIRDSRHEGGLYKTNLKTLAEGKLHSICGTAVDLCDGPNQCIYFCVEGQNSSVIRRHTGYGKILQFVDCGPDTDVRCLDFVNEKDEILALVEKRIYTYIGEFTDYTIHMDIVLFNTTGQCLKVTKCWPCAESDRPYYHRVINADTSPLILQLNNKNGCGKVRNVSRQSTCIFEGAIGFQPANTFHPTGICVDDQGEILVSDRKNQVVYLLNKYGMFEKVLLSEEDGLDSPTALTLDKIGYLWIVCSYKVICVKYEPDNKPQQVH